MKIIIELTKEEAQYIISSSIDEKIRRIVAPEELEYIIKIEDYKGDFLE